MALTAAEVQKIAFLARIAIHQDAVPAYLQDLSNILQLVSQIDSVETDNIPPMAHPLNMSQPLRTDKVVDTNQRDHIQAQAPATSAGLYLVPKVIDN